MTFDYLLAEYAIGVLILGVGLGVVLPVVVIVDLVKQRRKYKGLKTRID